LVTVVLTDANGNSQLAQVTFTSVTQPGLTVATLIAAPPTLPSAVIPLTPFFDITTTAVYTSPVQVCLNGSAFASDDQLLHFENGVWVNITNTLSATQICGSISSLSPFVVVRPHYVFTGFFEPVDNPPITNVAKSGSTVSVKWQLKTASGALISDVNSFTSLLSAPVACDTSSNDAIETELSVAGDTVPHFDGTQHFAKFRFR
jgi:hypothetical protein